jgi:hypothetical protein
MRVKLAAVALTLLVGTSTLLIIVAWSAIALRAQSSCPTRGHEGHFLQWGDVGEGVVYSPVVPKGEDWIVTAGGLFSNTAASNSPISGPYPPNTEWMMELIEPIPEVSGLTDSADPSRCCWRVPVLKQLGGSSTPVAALTRPILLLSGRRLAGRTVSIPGNVFGITGVYWVYPAGCVDALSISGAR